MLVLGIDPGTATTGYGLIRVAKGKKTELVDFGWIRTEKNGEQGRRLIQIYKGASSILRSHNPDVVAIERLFFFANAKTVMQVGQAHGVLLLAAARARVPVFEYAPIKIKHVVTGSGRADKKAIKKVVRQIFGLRSPKRKRTNFDDVADAIAVALCHVKISKEEVRKSG